MDGNKILLVEDNPDDVALTMRAFKRHGLVGNMQVAKDGVEALEYLFGTDDTPPPHRLPHIILLDLNLPRVGGLQVLERIRADERTRAVPVVILTSSTEPRDLVESYRLGANSYVRKPVDFVEFTEAAKQLGVYWLQLNRSPVGHDDV